jgi:hypoxanthine-guanine phosphoribosyltransferase
MTCEELKKALEANQMQPVVLQHKRSKKQYKVENDMLAYCDEHHKRAFIYGIALDRKAGRRWPSGKRQERTQWFYLDQMQLA